MAFGAGGVANVNVNILANAQGLKQGFDQAASVVQGFERVANTSFQAISRNSAQAFQGLQIPTNFEQALSLSITKTTEFDAAMRNLNAVAHMNDTDFQNFSNTILHMNDTLHSTVGAAEAARASYVIMSSGFTDMASAQKVLEASILAANAGLTDTYTSAKLLSGALNAYNMDADQATHVSDIMFKTVEKGVVTYGELAKTLGRVAPIAHENGIKLEELGAMIATLTDKGIPTTRAMTGVMRAITALSAPTAQGTKTLAEFGITTQQLADTISKDGLVPALKMVIDVTGENKRVLRDLLGESTAVNAALALAGKDSGDTFKNVMAEFTDVGGATAAANAQQSQSIAHSMGELRASIETAAIVVGQTFSPALIGGIKVAKEFSDGIGRLDSTFKSAGDVIAANGNIIQVALYGIGAAALFVAGITATATAGFTGILAVMGALGFGTGALAGEMAALAIPFAGLGAAALAFVTSFTGVVTILGAVAAGFALLTSSIEESNKQLDAITEAGIHAERSLKKLNDVMLRGVDPGKYWKSAKEEVVEYKRALEELVERRNKANSDMQNPDNDEKAKDSARKQVTMFSGLIDKLKAGHLKLNADLTAIDEGHAEAQEILRRKDQENFKRFTSEMIKIKHEVTARDINADQEYVRLQELEKLYKKILDRRQAAAQIEFEKDPKNKGKTFDPEKYMAPDRQLEKARAELSQKEEDNSHRREVQHEKERHSRMQHDFNERNRIADTSYKKGTISYEEYIKRLSEIGRKGTVNEGEDGDKYGFGAKQNLKIVEQQNKHSKELENIHKKEVQTWLTVEGDKIEIVRKSTGQTVAAYMAEAAAYKKMAADKVMQEEQFAAKKEDLLKKAAAAEATAEDLRFKLAANRMKAEQNLQKEKLKDADEEMDLEKRKVEAGMTSETRYTELFKKRLKMQEDMIEMEKQQALHKKELDPAEKEDIELTAEQKLRELRRQSTDEYIRNIKEISSAKQEGINKTKEQIQKEKELQDMLSKEGKGNVMSLDDFVKSMNSRWEGAGERGPITAGAASQRTMREQILKEQAERRKAEGMLGVSHRQDGAIWEMDSHPFTLSPEKRAALNASKRHGPAGVGAVGNAAASHATLDFHTSLLTRIATSSEAIARNSSMQNVSAFKSKVKHNFDNGSHHHSHD